MTGVIEITILAIYVPLVPPRHALCLYCPKALKWKRRCVRGIRIPDSWHCYTRGERSSKKCTAVLERAYHSYLCTCHGNNIHTILSTPILSHRVHVYLWPPINTTANSIEQKSDDPCVVDKPVHAGSPHGELAGSRKEDASISLSAFVGFPHGNPIWVKSCLCIP
jgi:hypothetical protein